jgi:hypothetical protein
VIDTNKLIKNGQASIIGGGIPINETIITDKILRKELAPQIYHKLPAVILYFAG